MRLSEFFHVTGAGINSARFFAVLFQAMNPRSAMPRTMKSSLTFWGGRGFTFTELLVVIALLVLLMGAAVPAFTQSEHRARLLARDWIQSSIQRARAHAMARGVSTALLLVDHSAGQEWAGKMLGLAEVVRVSDITDDGEYQVKRVLQRWDFLPGSRMVVTQALARHHRPTIMESAPRAVVVRSGQEVSVALVVFSPRGSIELPHQGALELIVGAVRPKAASEELLRRESFDLLQIHRLTGRVQQRDLP